MGSEQPCNFRPCFGRGNIIEARQYVREQYRLDEEGEIPANYVARSVRRRLNGEAVDGDDADIPAAPEVQARAHQEQIQEAFENARGANEVKQRKKARRAQRHKAVRA